MKYTVDEKGFYGRYGGAYIPEMLHANIEELQSKYISIIEDPDFQLKFRNLLADYSGRPTPLYYADRLSAKYNSRLYLKRVRLP